MISPTVRSGVPVKPSDNSAVPCNAPLNVVAVTIPDTFNPDPISAKENTSKVPSTDAPIPVVSNFLPLLKNRFAAPFDMKLALFSLPAEFLITTLSPASISDPLPVSFITELPVALAWNISNSLLGPRVTLPVLSSKRKLTSSKKDATPVSYTHLTLPTTPYV